MVEQLFSMKRKEAVKKMENGIGKTLPYCDFLDRIRTNKVIERLDRKTRCGTCVVGSQ